MKENPLIFVKIVNLIINNVCSNLRGRIGSVTLSIICREIWGRSQRPINHKILRVSVLSPTDYRSTHRKKRRDMCVISINGRLFRTGRHGGRGWGRGVGGEYGVVVSVFFLSPFKYSSDVRPPSEMNTLNL